MELGWPIWRLLWVVALVNGCWFSCNGCWEEERSGLLQLKASINHPHGTSLTSWVEGNDTSASDCCQWESVKCSNTSGRVIELSLGGTRWDLGDWYANASLFVPFEELTSLDLWGNSIVDWSENQGSQRLSSKLSNLEVLDLSSNKLNKSILSSLSGLSSLKSLYLYDNKLQGSIHTKEFDTLTNLEELDLSWNQIDSFATSEGSQRLSSRLSNLEFLYLSSNKLNNSILSSLSGLSSLKSLYLDDNKLQGSIHTKELDTLTNLENLDLSGNQIDSFATAGGSQRLSSRLSNLEFLYLSSNKLNNSILSSLSGLSSLKSLYLRFNKLQGSIHTKELDTLTNLENLDLSGNQIDSFATSGGSQRLSSRLSNLEFLYLSSNKLNNSILSSLSGFSSLESLYLRFNKLQGSIHTKELDTLTNLEELDLSWNQIDSFATSKGFKSLRKLEVLYLESVKSNDTGILLQSLGAFSSLKVLYFTGHNMTGTITAQNLHNLSNVEDFFLGFSSLNESFLQSIGVMTSLKVLSLFDCQLNGALNAQGLRELKNLRELVLSRNDFQGILPSGLGNLTSLRVLDLSSNQFTENIASSPLTRLTSLEYLCISNNHFQVPISFKSFVNHSSLKVFLGDNNTLVEPMYQTWVPRFQLKVFTLSNCRCDELNLAPPNFLYNQYDLRVVDLSHSNFGGKLPTWLLQNNTRFKRLYLRNNSFIGPFELPSHPNSNISTLDVSNNKFQGQIPTNISLIFPNLWGLNMSRNAFKGNIPSSFGDLKSLEFLDLSNNQLSGGIPEHLAMGCSSLNFFKLSNNSLRGQIFPSFFNLTNLRYLYLDGNNFEGEIPNISSAIDLRVLDVRNNFLSGKLPRWMGSMSNLEEIAMSKNQIEGPIPKEFCKLDMLEFLDLSENNLSSSIPPCSSPLSISHVHLNKNRLTGPINRGLFYSYNLVTLDLGDNNLIGTIPNWIGNLSKLSILILKANHLEGRIPIQLCHLSQLSIMDLSRNNLSGTIPRCLSNITFDASIEKSTLGNLGDTFSITFSKYSSFLYIKRPMITVRDPYSISEDGSSSYPYLDVQVQVEFTTKSRSYSYSLNFMSGVDLSCNQLTGEIPPEIGKLSNIHALNLSHNNLTGSIPTTFSNLSQIESLDLSYNNLNGRIPTQLIELNYLAVFRVGHNNLSGRTPERKAQFATFEENSYEANPLLCGPPLHNDCIKEAGSPSPPQKALDLVGEDSGLIDKDIFCISFVVSYIIVLLGIATVLYINPYWRRAWFHLVEVCATSCYYFVVDNFHKLSIFRNM